MSAQERLNGSHQELVTENWTPTVSLRPHHLRIPEVSLSIAGYKVQFRGGPGRIPGFILGHFIGQVTRRNLNWYYQDLYGDSIRGGISLIHSVDKVLEDFTRLENEDVVQFDFQKDELCKLCVVGDHCLAINIGSYDNLLEGEREDISRLEAQLTEAGFEEGVDFIFSETTHVVSDYEGKKLSEKENVVNREVIFNSMLVKVGALRTIIK